RRGGRRGRRQAGVRGLVVPRGDDEARLRRHPNGIPPHAVEVQAADGSFCQRPNSLPCGSLHVANQPMLGTGIGSPASPPSSCTRAAPALTSSTEKYARVPRLPGSMFVIAPPCWSPRRVM